MVAGLDDKYSEFLDPAGFRAAIRRPTQAELDYLSSQAVGKASICTALAMAMFSCHSYISLC